MVIVNDNGSLIHGDCLEVLDAIPENSVDAVVTDPPYGLSFMGKSWDHGVPGKEYWDKVLRVAKPGAHMLAFGGTRTFHRLTAAIEDAGWEIRDCLMWVYGSGFPKSHDVSKAIDKSMGIERCIVATTQSGGYKRLMAHNAEDGFRPADYYPEGNRFTSKEAISECAKQWQGWGTALKPSWEPIILSRKPLEGTVAKNVLTYGTGAVNIDGCRVSYPDGDDGYEKGIARAEKPRADIRGGGFHTGEWDSKKHVVVSGMSTKGRWPANLIHDGSADVVDGFPDSKGQQGNLKGHDKQRKSPNGCYGVMPPAKDCEARSDSGSAARFFYCAKANKKDRGEGNNHPTVKPTELLRYLCRLITPPGGSILDPFMGSGSTGKAALLEGFKFIGIELQEEYVNIARSRLGW